MVVVPPILPLLLSTLALADCECGYSLSTTGPSSSSTYVFTDLVESNFACLHDISKNTDWVRQEFNLSKSRARGEYGEMFAVDNVATNPMQIDNADSGRLGAEGSEDSAGLQLIVRRELVEEMVPVAEIDTHRLDMFWGSFRASMRMTNVSGTCAAFFWYFNDTQEIDIEFLSKDFNTTNSSYPVNLVLQSREAMQAGFNAALTSNFVKAYLPFNPAAAFHEYRIDYVPGRVFFYADGALLAKMDGPAVPTSPGHLILQHWSNGNPLWTGGPPAQDTVLTVRYVKAYFNSSTPERNRDWASRCKNPAAAEAVCRIPDLTAANLSAASWFFSEHGNMTNNQTVYQESGASRQEFLWPKLWKLVGVLMAWGCLLTS
ncbi:glycoside hydrolase family 16 protein [Podospora didyma]|uniref:Glycoside hydrolase family 16 protein n=1 Tax=Podospora didyma TaxID=330526 RepID=A0AAE0KF57_9PEZI|nr:glycoside hydrolase family 16 protein [Podospora didyma]